MILEGPARKVVLIWPYNDISALGIRVLGSCLKRAGFAARLLFLPVEAGDRSLQPEVLQQVEELCSGSLFVGISVMSSCLQRVALLSKHLKRSLDVPIVWGGVHPTLMPEQCVLFADYLCIGEGEEAIVELAEAIARQGSVMDIRNIWPVVEKSVRRGPLRPLIQNIDLVPFPDYELADDYVLYEGQMIRMTRDHLEFFLQEGPVKPIAGSGYYTTMTSRGCDLNCSFCSNGSLRSLYPGQRWLRYRSPGNVIEELSRVRNLMPFAGSVFFCEDTFFQRATGQIEEFCRLYKREVSMPFFCLGTPYGLTREKLELLVDAGLYLVQIAIEAGNSQSATGYSSGATDQRVLSSARLLGEFCSRMFPPHYEVIVDSPFDSAEDVVQRIRLLARIKRPYRLQFSPLTLLPGTELAARARREGLLNQEDAKRLCYQRPCQRKSYLNCLLLLLNTYVPRFLIRFLASRPFRFLFNRRYFERSAESLHSLIKAVLGARRQASERTLARL